MYGLEIMSPVSCIFSPVVSVGPIMSRAEMYCELTFPGRVIVPPCILAGVMLSGGYPLFCV